MKKRNPSETAKLSKRSGASFEREIAHLLHDELGIKFQRNLEQTQTKGLSDLTPDDKSFPFVIECKIRGKDDFGVHTFTHWWNQAHNAASLENYILPSVIYRIKGQKRINTKAIVPYSSIVWGELGTPSENNTDWCQITFERFCKLCREIMAWKAET